MFIHDIDKADDRIRIYFDSAFKIYRLIYGKEQKTDYKIVTELAKMMQIELKGK